MSAQRHEDSNAPSLSELEADERELELEFKRGFDSGVEFQKKADPPPKAKQYRDEAIEARAQLANERAEWAARQHQFEVCLEAANASIADKAEALANLKARVNAATMALAHADGAGHLPCNREPAVVEACNELRAALGDAP